MPTETFSNNIFTFRLYMAGHTIVINLFFFVTFHTFFHCYSKGFGRGPRTFANVTMAGATFNIPQNHVPPVGKINIFGYMVEPFPFYFFFRLNVFD